MRTGMLVTMFAAVSLTAFPAQAQFAIADHPRVNPADFIVTKFADDLSYPVGMVELEDGSVLVAVSDLRRRREHADRRRTGVFSDARRIRPGGCLAPVP